MLLQFQIDGDKVLSRNLRILADGVTDFSSEFRKVGEMLERSGSENIDSGGSETGGQWKPLAPSTVAARRRRQGYYKAGSSSGPTTPILKWTGKLQRSFDSKAGEMQVVTTNTAPYYQFHQAKMRTGKLPRRLILEMSEQNKLATMNILAKGLDRKLEGGNYGRQF